MEEKGKTELTRQGSNGGSASLAKPSDQASEQMWLSKVTPQQAIALRELLSGAMTQEAAKAAGVDRTTLYRWRTQDPQFMAALSAWRNETHEHAMDQFLALSEASVAAVAHGIANCDSRLGLSVLKELNKTRERLDRPANSPRAEPANGDPDARVDQMRKVMQGSSSWEQVHVAELLKLGLEEHRTRMAERFRKHFGLPTEYEVSPNEMEMAACDALPGPNQHDPRKLDPEKKALEGPASVKPELEDPPSLELQPSAQSGPISSTGTTTPKDATL